MDVRSSCPRQERQLQLQHRRRVLRHPRNNLHVCRTSTPSRISNLSPQSLDEDLYALFTTSMKATKLLTCILWPMVVGNVLTDILCVPTCPTDMGSTAGGMVDIVLVECDRVRRTGEDKAPVVIAFEVLQLSAHRYTLNRTRTVATARKKNRRKPGLEEGWYR